MSVVLLCFIRWYIVFLFGFSGGYCVGFFWGCIVLLLDVWGQIRKRIVRLKGPDRFDWTFS